MNWDGLLAGAAQITAVASILGFGIVLAWMFGREFAEGTVTGLFGLPVSRTRIALAKLTVYALWATVVSVALTAGVLVLGLTLAYGPPSSQTWGALGRVLVLAMLSAGIAVPVAWVATFSRSLLAAVGCTVALVVVAEVGALAGAGAGYRWPRRRCGPCPAEPPRPAHNSLLPSQFQVHSPHWYVRRGPVSNLTADLDG